MLTDTNNHKEIFGYLITTSGEVYTTSGSKRKTYLNTNRNGYQYEKLSCCVNNRKFNHYIHRLVAAAFLGLDLTDKTMQVDHINHNTLDNRLENLRVLTISENQSSKKIHKPIIKYKNKWKCVIGYAA